jgi:NADPH-dependent curcumin reductase
MTKLNRQWLLKRRPKGMVSEGDFEYRESVIPEPNLNQGEILVRNLYLSFDPAMRGWMREEPTYLPPAELGEPMRASAVAQVIRSEVSQYPEGSFVVGLFGWQDYALAGPNSLMPPRALPEGTPLTMPLSIFGLTSLTAYFGLLSVGRPEKGDTVVVSGGAGATGSVVCQIARIKGCRVIGIAGGKKKCDWLLKECGIDAVIDYKKGNVSAGFGELCPDGINVFYDNVGGDILEAAIDHIAERGRIVLCGMIATYNDADPRPGPRNLTNLILRRVRMEGFIILDYMDRVEEARKDLMAWVMDGKIKYREDIQEGFENIPRTFLRLFEGKNQGKQLLKISDPAD